MLSTCASPSRVVWEYYDQCARKNPSFLAMAECGRQKRLAECVPNNSCSPEGNLFMEYADRGQHRQAAGAAPQGLRTGPQLPADAPALPANPTYHSPLHDLLRSSLLLNAMSLRLSYLGRCAQSPAAGQGMR